MKSKNWLHLISLKGNKGKVFIKTGLGLSSTAFREGTKSIISRAWYKGNLVGRMETIPRKTFGDVHSTDVFVDKLRGNGISSKMFKTTMQKLASLGKTHIRTNELQHIAQVKIRSKLKTKFVGYGLGRFGEGTAAISKQNAKNIILASSSGKGYAGSVKASTVIPKNINKLPKISSNKSGVRFIRVRGKIVPIKDKK